jgi:hypothetical protein
VSHAAALVDEIANELDSCSHGVSHRVHGPADVTAVLELFDRCYRDLRGEDDPYSSQNPA